jgi:Uma2 family endonuclease
MRADDSLEVIGSPDMVLEVVSPSSRQKDTVILRDLYWRAGVREYWLAERRHQDVTFDILRHGARGYSAARKQAGWVKSSLLGRSFKLIREPDDEAGPVYTLAVQQRRTPSL